MYVAVSAIDDHCYIDSSYHCYIDSSFHRKAPMFLGNVMGADVRYVLDLVNITRVFWLKVGIGP